LIQELYKYSCMYYIEYSYFYPFLCSFFGEFISFVIFSYRLIKRQYWSHKGVRRRFIMKSQPLYVIINKECKILCFYEGVFSIHLCTVCWLISLTACILCSFWSNCTKITFCLVNYTSTFPHVVIFLWY
jgi:hypothetical protein